MIHVTEKAAKKIRELLIKEGVAANGGLRLGVQGGGCSGLTYAIRLDARARDRDTVVEESGARVFVDPKSYVYLDEVTLDYEETLMRRGFIHRQRGPALWLRYFPIHPALERAAFSLRRTLRCRKAAGLQRASTYPQQLA